MGYLNTWCGGSFLLKVKAEPGETLVTCLHSLILRIHVKELAGVVVQAPSTMSLELTGQPAWANHVSLRSPVSKNNGDSLQGTALMLASGFHIHARPHTQAKGVPIEHIALSWDLKTCHLTS